MKKVIFSLLACCSISLSFAQNNLVEYQYWFDRNYANAISGVLSSNEFLADLPSTSLQPGEHEVHFRFKQSDGQWSSVTSQKFLRPIEMIAYQYWLDNDYADKNFVNFTTQDELNAYLMVNANSLTAGEHSFTFQAKQTNGTWSSPVRQKFIISNKVNIDRYEFWFDNDYANKTSVNLNASVAYFNFDTLIDAANLVGAHTIHYRTHQQEAEWSTVLSQKFVKQNKMLAYEYWFNDNYNTKISNSMIAISDFELSPLLDVSSAPLGSNTLFIRFKDEVGSWSQVLSNGFCRNEGDSAITIKVFLEGYYQGSGLMASVMQNQGVGSDPLLCDSIDVEMHQSNSPYAIVETQRAALKTDGTAKCYFSPAINGSYFLSVKHRNGIQTWSAIPIYKGNCPTFYDFTNTETKAFGDNLVEVENGVWAMYSGDINQDENIDLLDMSILDTDMSNFLFGYFASDINGDGNVDLLDSPITEANLNSFVFSAHP
ncbi:MAG: hypothetical protein IPI46_01800 [Bacteroidetes bacterium]|nr:hypothetical protein [Bacteroidota bacterium]